MTGVLQYDSQKGKELPVSPLAWEDGPMAWYLRTKVSVLSEATLAYTSRFVRVGLPGSFSLNIASQAKLSCKSLPDVPSPILILRDTSAPWAKGEEVCKRTSQGSQYLLPQKAFPISQDPSGREAGTQKSLFLGSRAQPEDCPG